MAAATLLSRVLGMVREIVYASFMGTTWVASAFLLAFQIPNLFRRLLGEGALTAAFIPIFKEKEKTHGEPEMWRSANAVISGLIVATSVLVVIIMLGVSLALAFGTPHESASRINSQTLQQFHSSTQTNQTIPPGGTVHFWTPGHFSQKTILMLQLLRVMLPYLLLVCLAAVFMGMLNARGHFFIPAMGATMLNVVMIASVYFLAPHLGLALPKALRLPKQVFALAFGVLAAGVAQAAFQLPTLARDGFRYRWVSPWRDETVLRVVKQMLPATIGVAAFQMNVVITQTLSYWVDDYVVSSFQYAVRLMELPQGLFGISLATYLLPTLSGLAADKNYGEFQTELRQGVGYLMFTNLIASVLLVALAEPIIRLLFEHGKFHRRFHQRSHFGADLPCARPRRLFHCQCSRARLLRAWRHQNADENQPVLSDLQFASGRRARLAFQARRTRHRQHRDLAGQRRPAVVCAAEKTGNTGNGIAARKQFCPCCCWLCWPAWSRGEAGRCWENNCGHATLALKIGAVFVPAGIAGGIYWLMRHDLQNPGGAGNDRHSRWRSLERQA